MYEEHNQEKKLGAYLFYGLPNNTVRSFLYLICIVTGKLQTITELDLPSSEISFLDSQYSAVAFEKNYMRLVVHVSISYVVLLFTINTQHLESLFELHLLWRDKLSSRCIRIVTIIQYSIISHRHGWSHVFHQKIFAISWIHLCHFNYFFIERNRNQPM